MGSAQPHTLDYADTVISDWLFEIMSRQDPAPHAALPDLVERAKRERTPEANMKVAACAHAAEDRRVEASLANYCSSRAQVEKSSGDSGKAMQYWLEACALFYRLAEKGLEGFRAQAEFCAKQAGNMLAETAGTGPTSLDTLTEVAEAASAALRLSPGASDLVVACFRSKDAFDVMQRLVSDAYAASENDDVERTRQLAQQIVERAYELDKLEKRATISHRTLRYQAHALRLEARAYAAEDRTRAVQLYRDAAQWFRNAGTVTDMEQADEAELQADYLEVHRLAKLVPFPVETAVRQGRLMRSRSWYRRSEQTPDADKWDERRQSHSLLADALLLLDLGDAPEGVLADVLARIAAFRRFGLPGSAAARRTCQIAEGLAGAHLIAPFPPVQPHLPEIQNYIHTEVAARLSGEETQRELDMASIRSESRRRIADEELKAEIMTNVRHGGEESEAIEHKASFYDWAGHAQAPTPVEGIHKSVIALLNRATADAPGRLVIGIDDDGQVVGVDRDLAHAGGSEDKLCMAVNDHLRAKVLQNLPDGCEPRMLQMDDALGVLVVTVPAGTFDGAYTTRDQTAYRRQGASSVAVTPADFQTFIAERRRRLSVSGDDGTPPS